MAFTQHPPALSVPWNLREAVVKFALRQTLQLSLKRQNAVSADNGAIRKIIPDCAITFPLAATRAGPPWPTLGKPSVVEYAKPAKYYSFL